MQEEPADGVVWVIASKTSRRFFDADPFVGRKATTRGQLEHHLCGLNCEDTIGHPRPSARHGDRSYRRTRRYSNCLMGKVSPATRRQLRRQRTSFPIPSLADAPPWDTFGDWADKGPQASPFQSHPSEPGLYPLLVKLLDKRLAHGEEGRPNGLALADVTMSLDFESRIEYNQEAAMRKALLASWSDSNGIMNTMAIRRKNLPRTVVRAFH